MLIVERSDGPDALSACCHFALHALSLRLHASLTLFLLAFYLIVTLFIFHLSELLQARRSSHSQGQIHNTGKHFISFAFFTSRGAGGHGDKDLSKDSQIMNKCTAIKLINRYKGSLSVNTVAVIMARVLALANGRQIER